MADLRAPGALDAPEALVPLARSGDRLAFARIVRLHRADMAGVAFVVTGDERLALEAVARAWPVAAHRLGGLREPARLGPWLGAIAGREALGLIRQRPLPAPSIDGEAPTGAPGSSDAPDSVDEQLAAALAALSPGDRLLIALVNLVGSTPEELARVVGVDAPVAMARLAAAEARSGLGASQGLAVRLRAYATIPLPPVDIDKEARRAILIRNDHRIRIASVVLALVVTAVVVSVSYVAVGPPLVLPDFVVPSPTPSLDATPLAPTQDG